MTKPRTTQPTLTREPDEVLHRRELAFWGCQLANEPFVINPDRAAEHGPAVVQACRTVALILAGRPVTAADVERAWGAILGVGE